MDRAETINLLMKIKRSYLNFTLPTELPSLNEVVDEWQHYLREVPFSVALENLERHVMDPDKHFYPKPGELAKELDLTSSDQLLRSRESAQTYLGQLQDWKNVSVPPSEEIRQAMRLPQDERKEVLKRIAERKTNRT